MSVKTIRTGEWVCREGRIPEYWIYRLLTGKVSIHKNNRKIRELEIQEGTPPAILGITALLSTDRLHTASIRAETDLQVEKIYIDQLRKILTDEIPALVADEVSTMVKAIDMGTTLFSLSKQLDELPPVSLKIPDDLRPETKEMLSEIKRMHKLILSDVEELADEALRSLEEVRSAMMTAALDGIVVMDETGTTLEFNPSAQQIFGYTLEEVRGKLVADLIIPPAHREAHRQGLEHYLATGEGRIIDKHIDEMTAIRKSGEEFPVELTVCHPVMVAGRRLFYGFLRDLSESGRGEVEADPQGAA